MSNFADELVEKIRNDFTNSYNKDSKIKELVKSIANGSTSYEDANLYAVRTGELMSKALQANINTDTLTGGYISRELANEVLAPVLGDSYNMISQAVNRVQQAQNKNSKIGLKPGVADLNVSRIEGLADKISYYDTLQEGAWILKEPIINYAQAIVDDSEAKTMQEYSKAGMEAKIIREAEYGACPWCQDLEGEYDYEDVRATGSDVYRRHENCRCIVTYENGSTRQDVYSKAQWQVEEQEQRVDAIRNIQEQRTQRQAQKDEARLTRTAAVENIMKELGYSPKGASIFYNVNKSEIDRVGLDYVIDANRQTPNAA